MNINMIFISIIFILLIVLVILYFKYKQLEQDKINGIIHKTKYDIEKLEEERKKKEEEQKEVEYKLAAAKDSLTTLNNVLNEEYETRYDKLMTQLEQDIEDERSEREVDILNDEINTRAMHQQLTIRLKQQYEELQQDYDLLKERIVDYKKKVDAINEENLRQEKLELEQDAHRIMLSEADKADINYLITIVPNLRHPEILYKLIWSEYLIKPFQNMIKQSFGGKVPSNVIYCIENINTHKKYIGKTQSEVSKRWTEHVKTSLNIGGVSRSRIHDSLYLHWDEFTFSVIEVTTKEKLTEREKYYINFYESDKYGYNIKVG